MRRQPLGALRKETGTGSHEGSWLSGGSRESFSWIAAGTPRGSVFGWSSNSSRRGEMGKADALFGLSLLRGCRLPKQHNGFVLKYTISRLQFFLLCLERERLFWPQRPTKTYRHQAKYVLNGVLLE